MGIRIRTKVKFKQADSVCHLAAHGSCHGRRTEGAEFHIELMSRTIFIVQHFYRAHKFVWILVGINIDIYISCLFRHDLVVSEGETCNVKRFLTLPRGYRGASISEFYYLLASCNKREFLRAMEGDLEILAGVEIGLI